MPKSRSSQSKRDLKRLSVSIIGAGRLGTALGIALENAGYEVQAVVCRRIRHAQLAAKHFAKAVPLSVTQLKELPPSQLMLITTPDGAIAETARRLLAAGAVSRSTVVLHTSGALSSEVLSDLRKTGSSIGSIHPLVAVSDSTVGAKSLEGAIFSVEGDRRAIGIAKAISRALDGESFSIEPDKKPLYHASALLTAGHMVALFDTAGEMLSRAGMKRTDSHRVLLRLLSSTVNNLENSNPMDALTGTFARGDVATVKAHLAALRREDMKDALLIYRVLGRRSLELSQVAKRDSKLYRELQRLLDQ